MARRPLFVATADTHLSKQTWAGRPAIVDDSYRAFAQVVDLCLKLRVPLLLGGDVFDKRRPDPESVSQMCEQLSRMQNGGLEVVYTQGQHELSRESPWLGVHVWPKNINEDTYYLQLGQNLVRRVYGLDWQPAGILQQKLATVPEHTTVLLCHQVWREHMGEHIPTEGSLTEIVNARYVITGDYHVHQTLELTNCQGQPLTVLSPGSTCLRSLSEDWRKAVFVCYQDTTTGELSFESVPLKTRGLIPVDLSTPQQLEAFVAGYARFKQDWCVQNAACVDPDLQPIISVRYNPELPEAVERVLAAAGSNAGYIFFRAHESPDWGAGTNWAAQAPEGFETLLTAVPHMAPAGSDACEGALRLLRSPDKPAELAAMYAEHMQGAGE